MGVIESVMHEEAIALLLTNNESLCRCIKGETAEDTYIHDHPRWGKGKIIRKAGYGKKKKGQPCYKMEKAKK